ncbi:hypothetical protein GGD46_004864 [Rhizobium lusitanum]|uniref:Uncharacterized protein n=1 Tax=Rhizobium lusitanum TaxID=293958 RepID=A0A7X0IXI8_9HYPH|nr:hypothetical protein [Rhizobium lusitanum]
MPSRFSGFDISTILLVLWLVACAVFFVIDYEFPTILQPLFTRQILPSEDVI